MHRYTTLKSIKFKYINTFYINIYITNAIFINVYAIFINVDLFNATLGIWIAYELHVKRKKIPTENSIARCCT